MKRKLNGTFRGGRGGGSPSGLSWPISVFSRRDVALSEQETLGFRSHPRGSGQGDETKSRPSQSNHPPSKVLPGDSYVVPFWVVYFDP